ncbi:secondary thiamine-phosphate synthase enzyme YjbQ [Malonomonas rubra]|uniref:secondary thiamine-phosphate synthase enzyme YjbQ n=1 Tax=Malonomonas rubra TaxID=57040 RepID=UPI0026EA7D35|nr:secondary thiamine-phosphate synthase enzyme YjbQ [Malonomonas rubra]
MTHEISVRTEMQVQLREITAEVQRIVSRSGIQEGLATLFVPHTTAAVTINENADPDVVTDMINGLNELIPQQNHYRHLEGNSAAHIKSSLIGASEQIIIHKGKLQLGTWQGIYFCEFDGPRTRKLQIKLLEG